MLESVESPATGDKYHSDRMADGRSPGRPRCDATRQAILKASYELLAEGGLARFNIEAVAARSGSAKTTIYRWWPSKGALAMESALAVAQQAVPLSAESECPIMDMRAHLHGLVRLFSGDYGRVLSGIVAEGQADPEVLSLYREHLLKPRRDIVREQLQRGISMGRLRPDLDLDVALDLLYGGIYTRLLLRMGSMEDGPWVDHLVDCALNGISTGQESC